MKCAFVMKLKLKLAWHSLVIFVFFYHHNRSPADNPDRSWRLARAVVQRWASGSAWRTLAAVGWVQSPTRVSVAPAARWASRPAAGHRHMAVVCYPVVHPPFCCHHHCRHLNQPGYITQSRGQNEKETERKRETQDKQWVNMSYFG